MVMTGSWQQIRWQQLIVAVAIVACLLGKHLAVADKNDQDEGM
jgi:hypothetical protein